MRSGTAGTRARSAQDARDTLTTLGLDLTEHAGHDYVEAVLHSSSDAATLSAAGFTWTVTIADLGLRERQNNEINAAYAAAVDTSPLPSGRDTYRTLADYETDLRALAQANPGLVEHFTLSRNSLEGRDIVGVEISENVASATDGKPVFLMMGCITRVSGRRASTRSSSRSISSRATTPATRGSRICSPSRACSSSRS